VRAFGGAEVFKAGHLGDAEAFGDQSPGVRGDRQVLKTLDGRDAPVESVGALGGLGGVLGDVSGDRVVGQFAVGGDGGGYRAVCTSAGRAA
jgi:hypothetical protein